MSADQPTAEILPPTLGNFVVREEIGQGSVATVYLAEHRELDRRVAVKVLRPHLAGEPALLARFLSEAKLASTLSSPHIPQIFDVGQLEGGLPYFTMELLSGRSLAEILESEPPRFPLWRTVHIARGIGEALGCGHEKRIVHGRLEPANILLTFQDDDPDFVKVLGFGVARAASSQDGSDATPPDAHRGALPYMSPEQCCGADANVDARADIYSLGVIAYQLLAGQPPFSDSSPGGVVWAHMTRAAAPLRALDPSIPEPVEAVVARALEIDPARRFPSVAEFVRELEHAAAEADAPAEPASRPLLSRRQRVGFVAVSVATVAICALVVGVRAHDRREPPTTPALIAAPQARAAFVPPGRPAPAPKTPAPRTLEAMNAKAVPAGWHPVDFAKPATPPPVQRAEPPAKKKKVVEITDHKNRTGDEPLILAYPE